MFILEGREGGQSETDLEGIVHKTVKPELELKYP